MAKDLAIVLNSGSVNSAVATALAAQKHRAVLLHAEVSPRPGGARERAAYDQQVQHFKPYREHTLSMPFLAPLAQHDPTAPAAAASDPRQRSPVAPQMLALLPLLGTAARFADHYGATAIFLGLRVGPGGAGGRGTGPGAGDDLAQATEYTQVWNELLQLPCGQPDLEVVAPLLELEPWQVVDVGFQALAPFDRTWSCAEEGPEPCWACPGCRAREAAFQQAGKPDPLRAVKKG